MSNIKSKIDISSFDDLLFFVDEVSMVGATEEEIEAKQGHPFFSKVLPKIKSGSDLSKIIREEVHTRVKSNFEEKKLQVIDDKQLHLRKKQELYGILENLNNFIDGRSVEEVIAFFTSLHDIVSQLCLQVTEGVVVAKIRLQDFFDPASVAQSMPREFTQEVSLIFSKDEINALHMKMPEIPDKDPFKPLFSAVLDQSYDMVLFNELSGRLLIYMTHYFIQKLCERGFRKDPKVLEFAERYSRTKNAFYKSLQELKELESLINQHLENLPILNEFPKYLRMILQIKAGLVSAEYLGKMLMLVKHRSKEYANASKSTAFDFNKLPRYQHDIQVKQAIIITLQKETLQFTITHLEEDLSIATEELNRILNEIEIVSVVMEPNSSDFQNLMKRKSNAISRVEQSRKDLDVVRSQCNLVQIQHTMIKKAIHRFKEREKSMAKEPDIIPVKKIKMITQTFTPNKKLPQRMVMARRLRQS